MIDYKLFTMKTSAKFIVLCFRGVPPTRLGICYLIAAILLKIRKINGFRWREGGSEILPLQGSAVYTSKFRPFVQSGPPLYL
jgi:hypothetical protein